MRVCVAKAHYKNAKNTIHFSAKCVRCTRLWSLICERTTSQCALCAHIKSMLHTQMTHCKNCKEHCLSHFHLLSSQSHAFVPHRFWIDNGVCGIWSVSRLLCSAISSSRCVCVLVLVHQKENKAQYIFIACVRCVSATNNHKNGRPSRTHTIIQMRVCKQWDFVKIRSTNCRKMSFGRLREQMNKNTNGLFQRHLLRKPPMVSSSPLSLYRLMCVHFTNEAGIDLTAVK